MQQDAILRQIITFGVTALSLALCDTATTSRRHFSLAIARNPRKGCAFWRVISRRWWLDRLRVFFSSRIDVSDAVAPLDLEARALDAALRNASKLSDRWLAAPPIEIKSLVQDIAERATITADRIEIRLSRAKVAAALEAEGASQRPDLDPVVLSIDASAS